MMVNCPKCHLLQPKDPYCARCGINMETWQPPPQPLWKKIITNWMVQLAILFTVIFLIVMRDNLKSSQKEKETIPPPVAEQNFSQSRAQNLQRERAAPEQSQQPETPPPTSASTQNVTPTGSAATSAPEQEVRTDSQLQKRITLRVFLMNRILIDKLAQNSQRLSEASMIVPKVILDKTLVESRREFQVIGSMNSNFEMEQGTPLFVGEEDLETGLNIGFFLQTEVDANSTKDRILLDARQWNQLQLNGDMGPQSVIEATLSTQSSLIVLDLGAHDVDFSPEERSLFEASPKLRALNESGFSEGLSEIALVLTIE